MQDLETECLWEGSSTLAGPLPLLELVGTNTLARTGLSSPHSFSHYQ